MIFLTKFYFFFIYIIETYPHTTLPHSCKLGGYPWLADYCLILNIQPWKSSKNCSADLTYSQSCSRTIVSLLSQKTELTMSTAKNTLWRRFSRSSARRTMSPRNRALFLYFNSFINHLKLIYHE